MADKLIKKIDEVAFHRNGIFGAPFHAVLFRVDLAAVDKKEAENFAVTERPAAPDALMLGIVFDEPKHCAVICVDRIPAHGVMFGDNSWRGDRYEPELRKAIETHQSSGSVRAGPFAMPTGQRVTNTDPPTGP